MGELVVTALLCGLLSGGETELRRDFLNNGRPRIVRIDCETPSHVIEVGLDGRASARDSVHQAVFAAELTGKTPMVILIDTDGVEGRYEQEMRIVTRRLGIAYATCRQSFVERWAATSAFRVIGSDKRLDDLPRNASARRHCDLGPDFDPPDLGQ